MEDLLKLVIEHWWLFYPFILIYLQMGNTNLVGNASYE